jgi:hypothetical protein
MFLPALAKHILFTSFTANRIRGIWAVLIFHGTATPPGTLIQLAQHSTIPTHSETQTNFSATEYIFLPERNIFQPAEFLAHSKLLLSSTMKVGWRTDFIRRSRLFIKYIQRHPNYTDAINYICKQPSKQNE